VTVAAGVSPQLRDWDRINARLDGLGEAARSGSSGAPAGGGPRPPRASASAAPPGPTGQGSTAAPSGGAWLPHATAGVDYGAASTGSGAQPSRTAPSVEGAGAIQPDAAVLRAVITSSALHPLGMDAR
jgi:hypothetical protein